MALEKSDKSLHVIKASAGSGKTYQLAKIYIQNVLGTKVSGDESHYKLWSDGVEHFRHILAITFTNKATAEMKNRIIDELYALSVQPNEAVKSDYYEDFKTEFVDPIEKVVEQAGKALRAILFGYSAFSVSTIDSFFQNVLRSFVRELDRDSGYDLQLDDNYAVDVAVHSFLLNLGTPHIDKKVNDWAIELVRSRLDGNKDWDLFSGRGILQSFAYSINKEFFRNRHDEIRKYLEDVGLKTGDGSKLMRFKKTLVDTRNAQSELFGDKLNEFKELVDKNHVEGDLRSGWLADKIYKLKEVKADFGKTADDITADAIKKSVLKSGQKKLNDADYDTLADLGKAVADAHNSYVTLSEFLHNVGLFGLLGEIDKQLTQYREDSNTILISDTNELVKKTLEGGVPFVYERFGTKFDSYMIDEFQDTSQMQYDNFKPLLEEAMAGGGRNLIIGDEKQSIYRFRNSNPKLLQTELRKDFEEYYGEGLLNTSYRSFPAVVMFNNALFDPQRLNSTLFDGTADTAMKKEVETTYGNVAQKVVKTDTTGYVRINMAKVKDENGKAISTAVQEASVLELLPEYIHEILDRKPTPGDSSEHFKKFTPGDVLILVNTNDEGVKVVERILNYNETAGDKALPIVSGEALLLKNSPSVRLIVSVLRYIDSSLYQEVDSDGDERLAAMLRKHQRKMRQYRVLRRFESKMAQQEALGNDNFGELLTECFDSEPADQNETAESFLGQIKDFLPDSTNELGTVVNIVDRIVSEFLCDTSVGQETAFIMAFQDFVLDFCSRCNGGTVSEFLQLWDQKKGSLSVSSAADTNAIQVMTIHKSKGLEAPCVIIPFANWSMVKMGDMWVDKGVLMPYFESVMSKCKCSEPTVDDSNLDEIVPPLLPVPLSVLKKEHSFAGYYGKELVADVIDKLNKTYVAFTRAKQDLHIFAQKPSRGAAGFNDIYGILESSLRDGKLSDSVENEFSDWVKNEWDLQYNSGSSNDYDWYEFGEPSLKFEKNPNVTVAKAVELPRYVVQGEGASSVKMRLPESSAAQTLGTRMHAVFAHMRSAGDLDYALKFGVSKGFLTEGEADKWRDKISGAFADPTVAAWFAAENTAVYNERSIAFVYHDEHECRRPDRVVRRPDGTVVIVDYKFGQDMSVDEAVSHENQVREYMNIWRNAGAAAVKGYVWYVTRGKVVEVQR